MNCYEVIDFSTKWKKLEHSKIYKPPDDVKVTKVDMDTISESPKKIEPKWVNQANMDEESKNEK